LQHPIGDEPGQHLGNHLDHPWWDAVGCIVAGHVGRNRLNNRMSQGRWSATPEDLQRLLSTCGHADGLEDLRPGADANLASVLADHQCRQVGLDAEFLREPVAHLIGALIRPDIQKVLSGRYAGIDEPAIARTRVLHACVSGWLHATPHLLAASSSASVQC
jgi:hypothetical protein